jgi:hypothetical protein
MSTGWFIHAPQALMKSGLPQPQLMSSYNLSIPDDSVEWIYGTLKKCALISKAGAGIGLSIHNIRATGAQIDGIASKGVGIVPMLKNFDAQAGFVKHRDQVRVYLKEEWTVSALASKSNRNLLGALALRHLRLYSPSTGCYSSGSSMPASISGTLDPRLVYASS